MVLTADLITVARTFYDRGFEIVASREKIPAHPWKNDPNGGSLIPREKLYAMAMRQIESGRADSISLRLNADLAAIDLDFYSPDLTDEFVDLFDRMIGLPYTTAGKKGCKIFIRLENKDGIEKTLRIGNTLYPNDGSGAKNDLEIKCELSAVFGRHSDGIEYHAYPGCPGIWQLRGIDDLPVVPEWQIERLLNEAALNTGHVKSPNVVSDDDIARAYFCAGMALSKDPDAPMDDLENDIARAKTIMRFLDYFAYDFPSCFVKYICGFVDSSKKWPRLIARMAADFEMNADFFNAFVFGTNREFVDWKGKQLFRPAYDVLIESLMIDGFFADGANTSIFDLFERFERIGIDQADKG